LTIHKQTVLLHPILDEFYNDDPNHDRSSVYAVSKGLVSHAPGSAVTPPGVNASLPSSGHHSGALSSTSQTADAHINGQSRLSQLTQNIAQLQLAS
jgi:glutamine amidotransferase